MAFHLRAPPVCSPHSPVSIYYFHCCLYLLCLILVLIPCTHVKITHVLPGATLAGATLPLGEKLDFLEASPYWDQTNIPVNVAKQKDNPTSTRYIRS